MSSPIAELPSQPGSPLAAPNETALSGFGRSSPGRPLGGVNSAPMSNHPPSRNASPTKNGNMESRSARHAQQHRSLYHVRANSVAPSPENPSSLFTYGLGLLDLSSQHGSGSSVNDFNFHHYRSSSPPSPSPPLLLSRSLPSSLFSADAYADYWQRDQDSTVAHGVDEGTMLRPVPNDSDIPRNSTAVQGLVRKPSTSPRGSGSTSASKSSSQSDRKRSAQVLPSVKGASKKMGNANGHTGDSTKNSMDLSSNKRASGSSKQSIVSSSQHRSRRPSACSTSSNKSSTSAPQTGVNTSINKSDISTDFDGKLYNTHTADTSNTNPTTSNANYPTNPHSCSHCANVSSGLSTPSPIVNNLNPHPINSNRVSSNPLTVSTALNTNPPTTTMNPSHPPTKQSAATIPIQVASNAPGYGMVATAAEAVGQNAPSKEMFQKHSTQNFFAAAHGAPWLKVFNKTAKVGAAPPTHATMPVPCAFSIPPTADVATSVNNSGPMGQQKEIATSSQDGLAHIASMVAEGQNKSQLGLKSVVRTAEFGKNASTLTSSIKAEKKIIAQNSVDGRLADDQSSRQCVTEIPSNASGSLTSIPTTLPSFNIGSHYTLAGTNEGESTFGATPTVPAFNVGSNVVSGNEGASHAGALTTVPTFNIGNQFRSETIAAASMSNSTATSTTSSSAAIFTASSGVSFPNLLSEPPATGPTSIVTLLSTSSASSCSSGSSAPSESPVGTTVPPSLGNFLAAVETGTTALPSLTTTTNTAVGVGIGAGNVVNGPIAGAQQQGNMLYNKPIKPLPKKKIRPGAPLPLPLIGGGLPMLSGNQPPLLGGGLPASPSAGMVVGGSDAAGSTIAGGPAAVSPSRFSANTGAGITTSSPTGSNPGYGNHIMMDGSSWTGTYESLKSFSHDGASDSEESVSDAGGMGSSGATGRNSGGVGGAGAVSPSSGLNKKRMGNKKKKKRVAPAVAGAGPSTSGAGGFTLGEPFGSPVRGGESLKVGKTDNSVMEGGVFLSASAGPSSIGDGNGFLGFGSSISRGGFGGMVPQLGLGFGTTGLTGIDNSSSGSPFAAAMSLSRTSMLSNNPGDINFEFGKISIDATDDSDDGSDGADPSSTLHLASALGRNKGAASVKETGAPSSITGAGSQEKGSASSPPRIRQAQKRPATSDDVTGVGTSVGMAGGVYNGSDQPVFRTPGLLDRDDPEELKIDYRNIWSINEMPALLDDEELEQLKLSETQKTLPQPQPYPQQQLVQNRPNVPGPRPLSHPPAVNDHGVPVLSNGCSQQRPNILPPPPPPVSGAGQPHPQGPPMQHHPQYPTPVTIPSHPSAAVAPPSSLPSQNKDLVAAAAGPSTLPGKPIGVLAPAPHTTAALAATSGRPNKKKKKKKAQAALIAAAAGPCTRTTGQQQLHQHLFAPTPPAQQQQPHQPHTPQPDQQAHGRKNVDSASQTAPTKQQRGAASADANSAGKATAAAEGSGDAAKSAQSDSKTGGGPVDRISKPVMPYRYRRAKFTSGLSKDDWVCFFCEYEQLFGGSLWRKGEKKHSKKQT
ncbi:hypothetical protein HK102_001390 [Quaeritorhiza haematococci]|nr:hypothetical protein HK102_001390 [Quaeritorhiza haematococci]